MAAKKNKRTKTPVDEESYVIKAIRFPSLKLVRWIMKAAEKTTDGDRNEFIRSAAEKLSVVVLDHKLSPNEHFLPQSHLPRAVASEKTLRTNVMLPPDLIPWVEEASRRLNHHVSPFLAWATLLEAGEVLGKYPKVSRRRKAVGVTAKDGKKYTTMTVRFPVPTISRMDSWCHLHEEKYSRSQFLEDAIRYTVHDRIVGESVIDLLPEDHSLNGGKKMVSFRIRTNLRNDADSAGAVMNHSGTGFMVFAALTYLDSQDG